MKPIATSTALLFLLALTTARGARAGEGSATDGPPSAERPAIAEERLLGTVLRLEPSVPYRQAVLRVAGPGGYALTRRFVAPEPIDVDLLMEAEPPGELALGPPRPEGLRTDAVARAVLPDGRFVYEIILRGAPEGTLSRVGRFTVQAGVARALAAAPGESDAKAHGASLGGPKAAGSPGAVIGESVVEQDFVEINDQANDGTTFLTLDSDNSSGGALETWGLFNRFGDFSIEECGDGSNLGLCQRVTLSMLQDGANARVGVGTGAPLQELHVHSDDGGDIRMTGGSGEADYTLTLDGGSGDFLIRSLKSGLIKNVFHLRQSTANEGFVIDGDGLSVRPNLTVGSHAVIKGKLGVGVSSVPTAQLHVAGNGVIEGDVALGSSRSIKHAIRPLDAASVLETVRDLPLYHWIYKADPVQAEHVGPMAEEFYAAFGLGRDDKHVSPSDSAGLALAAVQGLDDELQNLRASRRELVEQNRGLVRRVQELERVVATLLAPDAGPSKGPGPPAHDP